MDESGSWVGVPALLEELSELDLVAEERTTDVDLLSSDNNDALA